jgi:hypothetical protein
LKRHIEPLERKCGHAEYNLAMFNHHNPKDFEEDYEYFKRCIERFYRLVDSEDNKLFIMTFQNNSDNEDEFQYCKNDVIEFSKKFRKHCSGKFYLFVIYHIIDVKRFHEFEYSDNIIFCKIHIIYEYRFTWFVSKTYWLFKSEIEHFKSYSVF